MRGSAQHAGPLAFLRGIQRVRPEPFALRAPYPAIIGRKSTGFWGQGVVLSRSSSCIRAATVLCAVAIVVGGCAGAANNTASTQGRQPYKTAYGISSEGTTTDLYTELFGPRKPAAAPETATAAAAAVQPVTASNALPVQSAATAQPAQGAAGAKTRQTKPAVASASSQQPQPAPVQVAQQPAAPQAPPEPDVPTVYGITANGPSTSLYDVFFGRSDANKAN